MEILKVLRVQWDRTSSLVAALLGALCLLLGWIGVSNTAHVASQLPYFISGGLFGIFLLAIACVGWVSADLKDEWRELHALRTLLDEDLQLRAAQPRTEVIDADLVEQIKELDPKAAVKRPVARKATARSGQR